MSTTPDALTGGCLCGRVRYRAEPGPAPRVSWCHCASCRRHTGSPAAAWLTVPAAGLTWRAGEPRWFRSSERAERAFCPDCGTPLAWRPLGADFVDLTLGTVDRAAELPPQRHVFAAEALPWLEIADDGPRHPGWPPEVG